MKCLYQEGHLLLQWVKEEGLLTPLPSPRDDVSKMRPLWVVMLAGNQGANEERGTSCIPFHSPLLLTHMSQQSLET